MKTFQKLAAIVFVVTVAPFCLCGVVIGLCRMADAVPNSEVKGIIIMFSCGLPWLFMLLDYGNSCGIFDQDDKPEPKQ